MNKHTASLILVYAVFDAPTVFDALPYAGVLPYAEYSPKDDPLRLILNKWTGNPISPRTLAANGHRDALCRIDKRVVHFDADDILLDAATAGDVELIEWFLIEYALNFQRRAFTTWGPAAEQYCTLASRNGRVDFLAWWWPQLSSQNQTIVDRIFHAAGDLSVLQWLEATARINSSLNLVLPDANVSVVCQMAESGSVAAMEWLNNHGVEILTANDWLRVAVRASAKGRGAVLNWIWDHHGTLLAAATFNPKDQDALMVNASARSDLLVLDYWLSKYRLHPQLFNFTLLGQRKVLAAAARNNSISCLEWWLERADGNVHITGWTKSVRKNRSKTGIVFPLKCGWFGVDWVRYTTVTMLEWWHAKCAEYGEPWIPPYLTDLAQAGSTDVLDWAWDHGSRTLDYFTQCDELGSSPDPHANSPDPLKMGMYLIAVGAAEGGWTHVLDWFWEKSLFNKDDLDNSARRAAVVASRQAHIHVLEWYRLKLASRHPWSFPVHHWSLMNRSGSVAVAKWWYQHSTAYVAAFRYRQFNCQLWRFASVETFEWMHACSRRHEASKNWYTAPLNMLLTAPTADKAWFWIRYCTTNPDQVALPAYFVVDPRVTRLKHLELVRSICQQHGLDATDQFRRAMVHLKCAEAMDQWWQTHFGSTL